MMSRTQRDRENVSLWIPTVGGEDDSHEQAPPPARDEDIDERFENSKR
jgi:hypothetical protein